jgi:competence protein ComFC
VYRRFLNIYRSIIAQVADLLFPRSCLGCREQGITLCRNCLKDIPKPEKNLPDWTRALFSYKSPLIKNSIWRLKYKYTYDIGKVFGELLFEALTKEYYNAQSSETRSIYLIPIPISKKRMQERGYNQARLLTNAILSCDDSGIFKDGTHFLKRKEMQSRQSHTKNKSARLQNIQGSFIPGDPLPPQSHFILIDDVVTTGATLEEAKKILSQMGACKISAYAIAH